METIDKTKIISPHLPKEKRRTIGIHIKISPMMSMWLKKNNYSPARILYESFATLGFREDYKPEVVKK